MRSFALVLSLCVFCLGCGIPEAVGDECGPQRNDYDMLSKRRNGMLARGVSPDAPVVRNVDLQLARARQAVSECSGTSS